MGAKTCLLGFSDGDLAQELSALPPLDRAASAALAAALFPDDQLEPLPDATLNHTYPLDGEVLVSRFGTAGVAVATDFTVDRPSELPETFLRAADGARTIWLHAMHSVTDWLAFAIWQDGKLVRSLSVSPDNGILEDLGERLPFELPFWRGDHPADDPEDLDAGQEPYPLPFHPLELGEVALREFFGFELEGFLGDERFDPHAVALMRFKRKRSLLRFWK